MVDFQICPRPQPRPGRSDARQAAELKRSQRTGRPHPRARGYALGLAGLARDPGAQRPAGARPPLSLDCTSLQSPSRRTSLWAAGPGRPKRAPKLRALRRLQYRVQSPGTFWRLGPRVGRATGSRSQTVGLQSRAVRLGRQKSAEQGRRPGGLGSRCPQAGGSPHFRKQRNRAASLRRGGGC